MSWSLASATVGLGVAGQSSPALADFTAFNAKISLRSVDLMLFIQDLDSEPTYYPSYKTWATGLSATMISTLSPQTHKLSAFTGGAFDSTGLNGGGGLAALATTAAAAGGPIVIRLAHEFNGSFGQPYGYGAETAAQFVAAWRHIRGVFVANGATNVLWFWCPNIWATPGETSPFTIDPTVDDGSGSTWYPGDAYVDIIGLDGYDTIENAHSHTPSDLFLANYTAITALAPTKPFGIGEFGCAADGRLSGIGGKAGWYALLFDLIKNHMPKTTFACQWERVVGSDDYTIDTSASDADASAAFRLGVLSAPFYIAPRTVALTVPLSGSIATPAEPRTQVGGMLIAGDRDDLELQIGRGLGLGSKERKVADVVRTTSVGVI